MLNEWIKTQEDLVPSLPTLNVAAEVSNNLLRSCRVPGTNGPRPFTGIIKPTPQVAPVGWVLLLSKHLRNRSLRLGFHPGLQDGPSCGLCPAGSGEPVGGRGIGESAGGVGEHFSKGEPSSTVCKPAVTVEGYQTLGLSSVQRGNFVPSQSVAPRRVSSLCLLPVQTCPTRVSSPQAPAPCC